MGKALHKPNFRSAAAEFRAAQSLYRTLFDQSPLAFVLLTPSFRIVNANDAFLAATQKPRDALAGLDIFEAFPPNPHDPDGDGIRYVRASFERVLKTAGQETMPVVRYDIVSNEGVWETHFWQPTNWAVCDESGSPRGLVQQVMDVTARVEPAPLTRLDQIADALLLANALNQKDFDLELDAPIRTALLRVGRRLADRLRPTSRSDAVH